jgi:hypothetical protein
MCKDPGIMKMFRVDRGAIKFVLAGANIMCPGLTSAGGALDEEVSADAPVVCALSLQLFHSCLSQWEESCFISLCKIGWSVLVY